MESTKPRSDTTTDGDSGQGDPGPGDTGAESRRTVLPADMSRFLVDFSIALHRVAMYPRDHPALVPVLDTLARRAEVLLQDRPRFAVGVARDRLVIEGVVSDVGHPLLRGLAEHLHRHHLAAVSFQRGVCRAELVDVVAALAEDPNRGRGSVGRLPKGQAPAWPHVTLHPLTIDGLEIVEDGGRQPASAASARYTDLWLGLARAALERSAGNDSATFEGEPAAVARAINEHQRVEAYDQVIVGYLLQIAEELRETGGAEAADLRRRVSAVVSTMTPDTLRRLLEMGGDALGRQQFLQNAAVGMAADAVVNLVKSAAEAADQNVSNGLVRLLTKLAAHAEHGTAAERPLANWALRSQVDRLLAEWSLPNPSPGDYTRVLDGIARGAHPQRPRQPPSSTPIEPLRMVQMCVELGQEAPALWRAVDRLADEGNLVRLGEVLEQSGGDDLAERIWAHVASADTVRRLLSRVPPDFGALDCLLPRLHGEALSPLFDLLTDSDDRPVRRAVFDRLRRLGEKGAAEIVARMNDDRWYLLRNLLALLAEMEAVPADCDPSPWLAHDDARVRREALRVALRLPGARDPALSAGLADADHRVLRIALAAARDACPPAAARQLVVLVGQEALDDDLRAMAIEALARASHGPQALNALLAVASRNGRILRGPALAPKSGAMLAALSALAANWARDERAVVLIRRAAASPDADIRGSVSAAS